MAVWQAVPTKRTTLVEFFGDDGQTTNEQIVAEAIRQMPLVAALMDVALRKGPEVAREYRERLNQDRNSKQDINNEESHREDRPRQCQS